MTATKFILLSLLSAAAFVGSTYAQNNRYSDNSDFWAGLDEDEEPYEHDFTDIPDLIDN